MHNLLAFPDTSRVWIYQSNKALPSDSIGDVNVRVVEFAEEWTSHNKQLRATGGLLHDLFLVLVADEEKAGASGCSIDASVRFVRQLEEEFQLDFFSRLLFAYLHDEKVHIVHRDDLTRAYHQGEINDSTLVFDNLVKNKGEFLKRWVTPFGESWMKRFV